MAGTARCPGPWPSSLRSSADGAGTMRGLLGWEVDLRGTGQRDRRGTCMQTLTMAVPCVYAEAIGAVTTRPLAKAAHVHAAQVPVQDGARGVCRTGVPLGRCWGLCLGSSVQGSADPTVYTSGTPAGIQVERGGAQGWGRVALPADLRPSHPWMHVRLWRCAGRGTPCSGRALQSAAPRHLIIKAHSACRGLALLPFSCGASERVWIRAPG